MKILIVGGGIGGLAIYHTLRKHLASDTAGISIKIVESHESPTRSVHSIGGGLGIAPNGLRAISSFCPEALSYLQKDGFQVSSMTFRNDKSQWLGQMSLDPQRYKFPMMMMRRAAICEALLPGVRQEDVRWGLEVSGVKLQDDGAGVIVEFADGTTETADLVIGADGVRSKVKDSLFKGEFPPDYDGLTGVGGFIELSALPADIQESFRTYGVTMTFGRNGFFGYSMCSPLPEKLPVSSATNPTPFMQWWSTYERATPPSRKEQITSEDIKEQLLARQGSWKSPYDSQAAGGFFKQIIELGCRSEPFTFDRDAAVSGKAEDVKPRFDTRIFVLPRYVTPRLPFWSNATSPASETPPCGRGRIVLIGDAAHTMPPDSGQGASCALEDALVYSRLLSHFLSISDTSKASSDPLVNPLEKAAKAYEELRKPRVHQILDIAKRNGNAKKDVGWFTQIIRDFFLWCAFKLPQSHADIFGHDANAAVDTYLAQHAT